jgi:hypothetical protein
MESNTTGAEAQYNQASFQQMRLHESFREINELRKNLFVYNLLYNEWNYIIVKNILDSNLLPMGSFLTKEEDEEIEKFRENIIENIEVLPIFIEEYSDGFFTTHHHKRPNYTNQNKIYKALYDYQKKIESLAKVHGWGNPTKSDPRKAIIGN